MNQIRSGTISASGKKGLSLVEFAIGSTLMLIIMAAILVATRVFSVREVFSRDRREVRQLLKVVKNDLLKKNLAAVTASSGDFSHMGRPECTWTVTPGQIQFAKLDATINVQCQRPSGTISKTETITLTERRVAIGGGGLKLIVLDKDSIAPVPNARVIVPKYNSVLPETKYTDASGSVIFSGVQIGDILVTVNLEPNDEYYFDTPPSLKQDFPINISAGSQSTLNVTAKRKCEVLVNFYKIVSGYPTSQLIPEVSFHLTRHLTVTNEDHWESSPKTSNGTWKFFFVPGKYRITPMAGLDGTDRYAGLDSPDTNTLKNLADFFEVKDTDKLITKDFHLPPVGKVSGTLTVVEWDSGSDEYIVTGNSAAGFDLDCYQASSNSELYYSDSFSGLSDATPSGTIWPISNTLTRKQHWRAGFPAQRLTTDGSGNYIANIAPMVAYRDLSSGLYVVGETRARYTCDSATKQLPQYIPMVVVAPKFDQTKTPPFLRNKFPADRNQLQFSIASNDRAGYPDGATGSNWYRAKLDGYGSASYNQNHNLWIMEFKPENLVHISGTIKDKTTGLPFPTPSSPDARVTLLVGRPLPSPGSGIDWKENYGFQVLTFNDNGVTKSKVWRGANLTIPLGQSTYAFPNILPTLGDNTMALSYSHRTHMNDNKNIAFTWEVNYNEKVGSNIQHYTRFGDSSDDFDIKLLDFEYYDIHSGNFQPAFSRNNDTVQDGVTPEYVGPFKFVSGYYGTKDLGQTDPNNYLNSDILVTNRIDVTPHRVWVTTNSVTHIVKGVTDIHYYPAPTDKFTASVKVFHLTKIDLCLGLQEVDGTVLPGATVKITRPGLPDILGTTEVTPAATCPFTDATAPIQNPHQFIHTFYVPHSGTGTDYTLEITKAGYGAIRVPEVVHLGTPTNTPRHYKLGREGSSGG